MRLSTTARMRGAQRGFGTLIGNGWLRESPRTPDFQPKGRSAMRKCHFMMVPEELKRLAPPPRPIAAMPVVKREEAPIEVRRRNPQKDVRVFPMYSPQARAANHAIPAPAPASMWWEDPIALGSLLILCPPVGLAAVWSSRRYSNDARWALTVMTALMMCLVSAVTLAMLALR